MIPEKGKRLYVSLAAAGLLSLAGAGVATAAQLPNGSAGVAPIAAFQTNSAACDAQQNDAVETNTPGPDTDNVQDQCGDQNAADNGTEDNGAESEQPGVLNDGKNLLPQASIGVEQAITAAQTAATGAVGAVDLEQSNGRLVFKVDIGSQEVEVDAANGTVVGTATSD